MAYGTALVDTIQSSTTGTPTQFQDGSGTQIGTLCRAWVNFNGTSGASPVTRASFNVSSVTRNSTGLYTLSFITSFTDANYVICGSDSYLLNSNGASSGIVSFINKATSSVQIITNAGNTGQDSAGVDIAIFR